MSRYYAHERFWMTASDALAASRKLSHSLWVLDHETATDNDAKIEKMLAAIRERRGELERLLTALEEETVKLG